MKGSTSICKIAAALTALSTCMASVTATAIADDSPTTFSPAAAAIVTGLSGLVTGAGPVLSSDRSTRRMMALRRQLTNLLLNADPKATVSFGQLAADQKEYILSGGSILCDVRGAHAVTAANSAYITSVTGTLDKFAIAPKITTISDALGSIFQNYSINVPVGKKNTETIASVKAACISDLRDWPLVVYGRSLDKVQQTEPTAAALLIGDDVNAVFALYQALNSIITPLVTIPAAALDAKKRADAITAFLKEYKTSLLRASDDLAKSATLNATTARLQAVGQFSEKIAAFRASKVDLSKIEACKIGIVHPILRTDEVKDGAGKVLGTYQVPTDDYVTCYAQVWQQLIDPASAVITAAAAYDSLADTSSEQLQQAVATIKNNIGKLDAPDTMSISDLSNAAALLIAYGTSVSEALSSANIEKVKTDLAAVEKLFGKN